MPDRASAESLFFSGGSETVEPGAANPLAGRSGLRAGVAGFPMSGARTSGHTQGELLQMTVEITAAYFSNNAVPAAEVAALIAGIHRALLGALAPRSPTPR